MELRSVELERSLMGMRFGEGVARPRTHNKRDKDAHRGMATASFMARALCTPLKDAHHDFIPLDVMRNAALAFNRFGA